jgi:hypothetical protein
LIYFLFYIIFIVYDYLLFIFLLFGFWDLFGGNLENRLKRGDFDMVLEEDLDMDL